MLLLVHTEVKELFKRLHYSVDGWVLSVQVVLVVSILILIAKPSRNLVVCSIVFPCQKEDGRLSQLYFLLVGYDLGMDGYVRNQEIKRRPGDKEVLIWLWRSQSGQQCIDNKILLVGVEEVKVVLLVVG